MEDVDAEIQSCEGTQSRGKHARGVWRGIIITVVVLLFLYPLSLGLMYYLIIRGDIPFLPISLIENIYDPLLRYASSKLPLAEYYLNYLVWWCELGNESLP